MLIREMPEFRESFKKLTLGEKQAVISVIELFRDDPKNPTLQNHPLRKPMTGLRSLFVSPDMRIIFREKQNYVEVLFLDIGTHEEIY